MITAQKKNKRIKNSIPVMIISRAYPKRFFQTENWNLEDENSGINLKYA